MTHCLGDAVSPDCPLSSNGIPASAPITTSQAVSGAHTTPRRRQGRHERGPCVFSWKSRKSSTPRNGRPRQCASVAPGGPSFAARRLRAPDSRPRRLVRSKLACWANSGNAVQHALGADVFVDIRPMHTVPAADQPPLRPLRCRSVGQPLRPRKRYADDPAVRQVGGDGLVRDLDAGDSSLRANGRPLPSACCRRPAPTRRPRGPRTSDPPALASGAAARRAPGPHSEHARTPPPSLETTDALR